ncbi:STAS/SEC14 domain-containing protein [Nocardioides sp. P5_C9_2]
MAEHGRVRLVYVLGPEFDEYEGEAVWEDLKLGARRASSFGRIAVVTDAGRVRADHEALRCPRPACGTDTRMRPGAGCDAEIHPSRSRTRRP